MDFRTGTYWHQGLFLQPQHFQRLEMHQHFLRKPLFETAKPYFWGVGKLELAPESLSARSVEIRAAEFIFRHNTYIEFPGNSVIGPRSFDKIWTDTDQPLDVYVGLKKLSPVAPNVTIVDSFDSAAGVPTRFASQADGEPMPDLYGDGPMATVPVLRHVVRIFFGPELASLDDYDLIPVGRLTRDNDVVKFSADNIPPCYAMSGSHALQDILRDIRDDMSGRMRQLSEYKAPRDIQRQEIDPDYFRLMQSLQALNRAVPTLVHYTETSQIHPWEIYGFLRVCVGEISTFCEQFDVAGRRRDSDDTGLPPYDHLQLHYCFSQARRVINQLLSEISVGPEFRVTLEPHDDFLMAAIPRDYLANRNRFYLVTQTASKADYSGADFVRMARLAAPTALPTLIDHALPGIDMIEVAAPPQGLPQRANARYYRIEQMSADWELVEQTAEVALFWPDAPQDLHVQLVVLRG
ncbi:MAG: type VI secretion system baseplate subunit TssK [Burkholderiaceae bacterium]